MPARELSFNSHITYGDLRRYTDTLDVTVCSRQLPLGLSGFYDESIETIVIDCVNSYCQKRCTLVHELIHWQHADNTRTGVYGTRLEHRTRRETALKLIDPLEYRTAEAMYEGDPYQIACELDVTLQVVQDYQRLLDSSLAAPTKPFPAFAQVGMSS